MQSILYKRVRVDLISRKRERDESPSRYRTLRSCAASVKQYTPKHACLYSGGGGCA